MATIAATASYPQQNTVKFVWTPVRVTAGPVNDLGVDVPPNWHEYVDRNVQITGTVGAGFTMVIEGGRDGTNYSTLNDAAGTALSFSAVGIKQIQEVTPYMRPRITAGEVGVTSVTVSLIARRERDGEGM